jgi:hypothetical protein
MARNLLARLLTHAQQARAAEFAAQHLDPA